MLKEAQYFEKALRRRPCVTEGTLGFFTGRKTYSGDKYIIWGQPMKPFPELRFIMLTSS